MMTPTSARVGTLKDEMHVGSAAEMYFRAALWMGANERSLSPATLRRRFGVSNATSYRWIAAYRAAKGAA